MGLDGAILVLGIVAVLLVLSIGIGRVIATSAQMAAALEDGADDYLAGVYAHRLYEPEEVRTDDPSAA